MLVCVFVCLCAFVRARTRACVCEIEHSIPHITREYVCEIKNRVIPWYIDITLSCSHGYLITISVYILCCVQNRNMLLYAM